MFKCFFAKRNLKKQVKLADECEVEFRRAKVIKKKNPKLYYKAKIDVKNQRYKLAQAKLSVIKSCQ